MSIISRLIEWLVDRQPAYPLGMILYDRGDRYATQPTLTARTQAGLLGAHLGQAGNIYTISKTGVAK